MCIHIVMPDGFCLPDATRAATVDIYKLHGSILEYVYIILYYIVSVYPEYSGLVLQMLSECS